MRSQEKNRISTAHESVSFLIKEHIAYLDQEIERIRQQIAGLIEQDPNLKGRKELLDSIPALVRQPSSHPGRIRYLENSTMFVSWWHSSDSRQRKRSQDPL